ncbi:protein ALP1-like [Helicoverpa zea]|uniref:protein ALP1-like n=1 Tax=Helicoverpa zea TaxID=7113 RepID=UPI001F59B836|nr:protein ALP1-like [Helicoverpa zea]
MLSDSDVETLLLLFALAKKKQRKRKWVHEINQNRRNYGEYHRLCREILSHEDKFYAYFKMTQECFEELHSILCDKISKLDTNWRRSISSRERLAICLRYLTTGDSYQTIAFSFRVGHSTVSNIVKNVCVEIWILLQPTYMPAPSEETWRQSEFGYRELWNFPNCVGSIDGKHIAIKCPPNSGTHYYCYKNYFSIVLLAIVDPFYKFIIVDIGSYGRLSDSGIFENSNFYQAYLNGKLLLPPKPLPGGEDPTPHVLIGDEGFALKEYLMRPFPRAAVVHDNRKKTFNYRLCRARRVVENSFGILAQKFRIFNRPIETNVETAIHIVKAACCLHNFIRVKGETFFIDLKEIQSDPRAFTPVRPTNQRSPNAAFDVREKFVTYFNNNRINVIE